MPSRKQRMAVLVEDHYQEMEVWYPIYRLREAGVDVVVVGTGKKDTYSSKCGYPCKADTGASREIAGRMEI